MPIDLAIKKDQPLPEAESIVRVYGEYIGLRVHQTTHRDYASYPCMNVIYVGNGNIEDMITQR